MLPKLPKKPPPMAEQKTWPPAIGTPEYEIVDYLHALIVALEKRVETLEK